MSWIESQPADLIVVTGNARAAGEPEAARSWVLRLPGDTEKFGRSGGKCPEWFYELRHVRLIVNLRDRKSSIPIVVLPSPTPDQDEDWYVAAKKKCVDASDISEPWILITHSPPNELERPASEEILTLSLSDAVRPTVTVCGLTRIPQSPQSQRKEVRIETGENTGPIPHHAWIVRKSPTGPIRLRDSRGPTSP